MIDFRDVSIAFAGQQVLAGASFHVRSGDRVGITGPNGSGKSTIFALINQEYGADEGSISLPGDLKIGYLHQHISPKQTDDTLLDYVEDALPTVRRIQHEIAELDASMSTSANKDRDCTLKRLGELQTEFEHLGGYELSTRAQTALSGLGFRTEAFNEPFSNFSGGWQMRAELARAMVARPDLLMLDEPTNFLDIPAVEWLRRFLEDYKGTLMLVSHDRYLLRSLTNVTLELALSGVTQYAGNYDYYIAERQRRHDQLHAAKANQDRVRAQTQRFIERFRSKNTKASQVQSRIKMLEKMEIIAVPEITARAPNIRVAKPPRSGQEVMRLDNAGITYDGENWVLRGIDLQIQKGEKTALIGMNGMGKTTLLRALAGQLPLNEGKRVTGHNVIIGYQSQNFAESMNPEQTVLATARAAATGHNERQVRSLLGSFFFSGDAVDKPVSVLSGGEKMRLAFARLLLNPPNLILLDEPTTHLDLASRETLEKALEAYEGTLLLVSHDVEFVREVATSVIAMAPPTVQRFPGGYDYYREKTSELPEQTKSAASTKITADKKTRRKLRTQQREELKKLMQPLRAKVCRWEKEVDQLEKEQIELTAQLADEQADFASLNRRLNQVHYEIQIATEAWERAAMELEELK